MAEVLKYTDIKNLDGEALATRESQLRQELFKMRMQKASEGMNKPHLQKVLKKNVARLLTARRAKQARN